MKRFLIPLLIVGMVVVAGIKAAEAVTPASDTFTITITVGYIGITLKDQAGNDYTTWAIGQVAAGTPTTMASANGGAGDQGVHVQNDSNVTIDLECRASNTQKWTLANAAGADAFKLEIKSFATWQAGANPDMNNAVVLTTANQDIANNVGGPGDDRFLYCRLTAPTSTTTGVQQTTTVTVEATAAP